MQQTSNDERALGLFARILFWSVAFAAGSAFAAAAMSGLGLALLLVFV
jgi:hypothetical protein